MTSAFIAICLQLKSDSPTVENIYYVVVDTATTNGRIPEIT